MSKAVLLSTRPRWCEKVATRMKTDEIRKGRPKLETPFKCYIYETMGLWDFPILRYLGLAEMIHKLMVGKGKVIGEFVCDSIRPITVENSKEIERTSCVSMMEMWKYARPRSLYDLKAWHISQLVIYDKPKDISEFFSTCKEYMKGDPRCGNCEYYQSMGEYPPECACDGVRYLWRAPQSWCYVEELT